MKSSLKSWTLLAALCFLSTLPVWGKDSQEFREAQRQGEDVPGGSLRWTFPWQGKTAEISTSGSGTIGGKSLQVPLNSTRLTRSLWYATYEGDLLLLVEETDEESSAGKLVRLAGKTLKPKWTCDIPNFNLGPGLIEGKFVFLSARATAMKVALNDGKWEWRKTNLNRLNQSTTYRFNSFGLPVREGQGVLFPEIGEDGGVSGSITFNQHNGEVLEIK